MITVLPSAPKSLKYLTNAALALHHLSYTTKSRLLVKGNSPVEFTQSKISKRWGGGLNLETVGQDFPKTVYLT